MHANEHLTTRQPCVVDRVSNSVQHRRLLLLSAAAAAVVSLTSSPHSTLPPSPSSFVHALHYDFGYKTGLFGKVLNSMKTYGCKKSKPNIELALAY